MKYDGGQKDVSLLDLQEEGLRRIPASLWPCFVDDEGYWLLGKYNPTPGSVLPIYLGYTPKAAMETLKRMFPLPKKGLI